MRAQSSRTWNFLHTIKLHCRRVHFSSRCIPSKISWFSSKIWHKLWKTQMRSGNRDFAKNVSYAKSSQYAISSQIKSLVNLSFKNKYKYPAISGCRYVVPQIKFVTMFNWKLNGINPFVCGPVNCLAVHWKLSMKNKKSMTLGRSLKFPIHIGPAWSNPSQTGPVSSYRVRQITIILWYHVMRSSAIESFKSHRPEQHCHCAR